jgi:GNAT superfamily N-acetyltransferase
MQTRYSERQQMQTTPEHTADLTIRHATSQDAALVLTYVHRLGLYQKMSDKVIATEAQIKRLLENGLGEAIIATHQDESAGFAFFSLKSSPFTGRACLYIDCFYVDGHVRESGFGKTLMGYLCQYGLERGCEMLEWGCLDWNVPAVSFYTKLGAYGLDGVTIFRLGPDQMRAAAELA